MFRYETHLHTAPVSKCATADVRNNLEYYKSLGYDGIFVTNHFLDGNINADKKLPYWDLIEFYFSDYEEAKRLAPEYGIKVFLGVELSFGGTDFLIYGLDKQWYLDNPGIMEMKKTEELSFMMSEGALVVQAHPFREASYIDHIRLFPRSVHGVEIINAAQPQFINDMARHYADSYELIHFAGSDNHSGFKCKRLAGMEFETPVSDELDFVAKVLAKEGSTFYFEPLQDKEESL